MGTPIATLRDDFANNVVDPAWTSVVSGSGTMTESGGQARCALPSSTAGTHIAYYRAVGSYDITGDGAYVNINTMVATGVAATFSFDAGISQSGSFTSYYRWRQVSGTLSARKVINGVDTQLYSVTWNATTFKYLRIRESGGTVYFDSSTNGTSWTNRATNATSDFAVTDLTLQFGVSCGNVASPGTLIVDDFNLLSLSSAWHWTEIQRPYSYRFASASIAAASGTGYIAVAQSIDSSGNLVSPRYFAGPQNSGRVLVEQANQAAAEAMAVALPTNGRWDLPASVFVEARYVRLYHRSTTGSSYTLREFYARRLLQTDDLEAESITTLLLRTGAVTADKISVLQLSAITADMGSITAGTITGALIRTAASGARIEQDSTNGLRSYNSGGTVQVQIRTTDGALLFGAGKGVLSAAGMSLLGGANDIYDGTTAITFGFASGANAWLGSYETVSESVLQARITNAGTSRDARIDFLARAQPGSEVGGISIVAPWTPGELAEISLSGRLQGVGVNGGVEVFRDDGSYQLQIVRSVATSRTYGLAITTSGAFALDDVSAGTRRLTINSGGQFAVNHTTPDTTVELLVHGHGATSATYSLLARNSSAANHLYVRNDGQLGANQAWTIFSDRGFKRQIADLDIPDAQIAGLLGAFKPSRYKLETDGDDAPDQFGFLAQEWQKHPLLNTLVRDVGNGKLGLVYDGALPIFALLLRRAFARIAALEARTA